MAEKNVWFSYFFSNDIVGHCSEYIDVTWNFKGMLCIDHGCLNNHSLKVTQSKLLGTLLQRCSFLLCPVYTINKAVTRIRFFFCKSQVVSKVLPQAFFFLKINLFKVQILQEQILAWTRLELLSWSIQDGSISSFWLLNSATNLFFSVLK